MFAYDLTLLLRNALFTLISPNSAELNKQKLNAHDLNLKRHHENKRRYMKNKPIPQKSMNEMVGASMWMTDAQKGDMDDGWVE